MNIIIGILKSIWTILKFISLIIGGSIIIFCIIVFLLTTGTLLGILIGICYIISPSKWKIYRKLQIKILWYTIYSKTLNGMEKIIKLFIPRR
jgi:hypothetical protein